MTSTARTSIAWCSYRLTRRKAGPPDRAWFSLTGARSCPSFTRPSPDALADRRHSRDRNAGLRHRRVSRSWLSERRAARRPAADADHGAAPAGDHCRGPGRAGDVYPVPLREGGIVYTKYSIDDASQVHAQVWVQKRARSAGQALTAPELGCGQPALSADEKLIAMVCNKGSNQSAELDVATFDPTTLTMGSPATLVSRQLVTAPVFSPDGKTIAYLAPSAPGGNFQLWTVNSSGPASVRGITSDLGLDATSAPVWLGG